jgi:hypothetical protein
LSEAVVESLDVKYTVNGGFDTHLDPNLVTPVNPFTENSDSIGRRPSRKTKVLEDQQEDCENQRQPKRTTIKPRQVSTKKVKRNEGAPKKKKTNLIAAVRSASILSPRKPPNAPPIAATPTSSSVASDDVPREIILRSSSKSHASSSIVRSPLDKYRSLVDDDDNESAISALSEREFGANLQQSRSLVTLDMKSGNVKKAKSNQHGTNAQSFQMRLSLLLSSSSSSSLSRNNESNSKDALPSKPMAVGPPSKNKLEHVYLKGVQSADKFIEAVVSKRGNAEQPIPDDFRRDLNRFTAWLQEILTSSDGMVEDEAVFGTMEEMFDDFDLSDQQVTLFLERLCRENKIMKTEGWIYNI